MIVSGIWLDTDCIQLDTARIQLDTLLRTLVFIVVPTQVDTVNSAVAGTEPAGFRRCMRAGRRVGMALTVGIRKNTLAGTKKAWRFHTSHDSIVEFDELLRIMAESNTALSGPVLGAAFMLITETVERLVSDGKFVKTPMGDYYVTATGSASSRTDHFEPHRPTRGHGLRLRFRPCRTSEARITAAVSIKRDDVSFNRVPCPAGLVPVDVQAGFRAGSFASLSGCRLGFRPGDQRLGIFLEPYRPHESGAGMPPLRASVYASVKPRLVIFQLPPELEPGDYRLVVRTSTTAGTVRKASLTAVVRVG